MAEMRKQLALVEKLRHERQKERWFLSAIHAYCDAVKLLNEDMCARPLLSPGMLGFRGFLATYTSSAAFTDLAGGTVQLEQQLAAITYAIQLKGMRVTVGKFDGEPELSAEVEETFARFRQGEVKDYSVRFQGFAEVNHVEGKILDFVAELHPEVFGRVRDFCERHRAYLDETIARFDREVQFYLAYLEYIEPLRHQGLAFCYPVVSSECKEIRVRDAFDLALARKLSGAEEAVVRNDVQLGGEERIIVVTGPNQGGKTTYARMFGQLHHLAALGLPAPGSEAQLFLPDRVFAHFEREEDLTTLRGKFEDELVRLHDILSRATSTSVLVMNESFTSTTLEDALFVGTRVLERIIERDIVCVCVTFVDELASLGPATVSMMSTVSPQDPAIRTFKVVRKPADGLAYALALAEKHGVSYARLRQRIGR
jgi:DNA mismatch repair ATPase MutS